jgi:hypothetical protein
MSSGSGQIWRNQIQRRFPILNNGRACYLPNCLCTLASIQERVLYLPVLDSLVLGPLIMDDLTLGKLGVSIPISICIVVVVEPFAVLSPTVQWYVVCNQSLINIFFFGSHQSRKIIKCAMNWKGFFAPLFHKCTSNKHIAINLR